MTNFIYTALGGSSTDKRVSRKNPTTNIFIQTITPKDENYYQKGKYSLNEDEILTKRTKNIYQFDKDKNLIKEWESAKEIELESKGFFKVSGIQKACRENRIYKGYYWEY